ncbi:RNA polymerase sigma factor [Enterovibrio sp. ZSDZ42]|uniref:RNA polymerase sigma factor n=1 Tax=Enterovibrio gelatinilyticus TaxID=2899819 RepID=A0ABT5R486_9GAMM|nr:RNA polymerase sigma factor [Enterovibrio sp. ZSDZ42]MDD1795083.1 RNA polymerase sigma factor [Enterovibrio sp. ZSDZ42]
MLNFFRKRRRVIFTEALLNQLYRYAFSLCHHEPQAYDLVQSCCEKILKNEDEATHTKAYMMRVIRNEFVDHCRRNQLELITSSEFIEGDENDSYAFNALEKMTIDEQHVDILLNSMSAKERELLYLWAVEGFSIQEIATLTDIPRGTLLSRLSRMKARLADEFGHMLKQVS